MTTDRARRPLFPFSVWPPMVDAVTLVLAAFVLITLVALLGQRALLVELRDRERELMRVQEDKARVERRLATLATGVVEIDEGKVILQGEVLFDSGSDQLRPDGLAFLQQLAGPLADLLAAEPGHMLMVGGHTDDRPIHTDQFPSNWELSTARAVAVMRSLSAAGVPPARIIAAGFGDHHPRASNANEEGRTRNRRIELLVVPIRAVSSR